MKRKVTDFMRELGKERESTDSSLGKNLNEPLLDDDAEGGSPLRGQSSLKDLASGEVTKGQKAGFGLPEKIILQDSDMKFLDRPNGVKPNQDFYEFFKQSFFDIPVQSFNPESLNVNHASVDKDNHHNFDIHEFSKELDDVVKGSVFRPTKNDLACNRDFLKGKSERYQSIMNYESQRPMFDANKEQVMFDAHMQEFRTMIQNQDGVLKCSDENQFENTTLENVASDAMDQEYIEDLDGKNEKLINKDLICSGDFSSQNWLLELRKTFYPASKEQMDSGRLHLELGSFNLMGKQESKGAALLHVYEGKEAFSLFDGNFGALFNHIQVRDTFYYFSIEKDSSQQVYEEYSVVLNGHKISDDSILENSGGHNAKIKTVSVTRNQIDTKLEGAKLMGAIFIKGQHDFADPLTGDLQFFFALIYAKDGLNPQICYDIRHISDQDKSLNTTIIKAPQKYEDKTKFFQNQEPVIFRLNANKVLNQMTWMGKMTKEDKINFLEVVDKQSSQRRLSKLMINNKRLSQDQRTQSKNVRFEMFVIGSLNRQVYDMVHHFFFVDRNLEVYDINKQSGLMNAQDVKETKDMLTQTLRMLSMTNSCNVIKFNSSMNVPETVDKVECRGQIEIIKRLFINVMNDDKISTKIKESKDTQEGLEDIQRYSDDENILPLHDTSLSQHDIELQLLQQKDQIKNLEFSNYACASIIDNINRIMIMNFYHKFNNNVQFVIQLPLTNLMVTWNEQYKIRSGNMKQGDTSLKGYNDLLYRAYKQLIKTTPEGVNPRFIISKKFDNIARDIQNVFWLQSNGTDNKQLLISKDQDYKVTQLRSRFQILKDNSAFGQNYDKLSQMKDRHQFIYSMVSTLNKDSGRQCYEVTKFINYTHNQTRIHFKNNKVKSIEKENKSLRDRGMKQKPSELTVDSDDEETIQIDNQLGFKPEKKLKNYINEFNLQDRHLILQNCIFVEDDREDIPVLIIGKEYKSVQFAIIRYNQVVAIASLRVTQEEIAQNVDKKSKFLETYPDIVQLCASSDIQEGHDQDGNIYMFQNFMATLFFPKMYRFRMNELQVKWFPNKDKLTRDENPFKVTITLMKIRDVIFKKKKDDQIIKKFLMVPLFETKSPTKERNSIVESEKKSYVIEGVQCYFKLKGGQTCYLNFRSLKFEENIIQEVNYDKRMFFSMTKLINQQFISGVYAETQFKYQIDYDPTSDTVNSKIFRNSQSHEILREANINALNSIPKDFIGLMDVPQINNVWFQRVERDLEDENQGQVDLQTIDLIKSNYKRYFNSWEILQGYQMLNQIGIIGGSNNKDHDFSSIYQPKKSTNVVAGVVTGAVTGAVGGIGQGIGGIANFVVGSEEEKVSRDPSQIVSIFGHLNQQQDDRLYDFKFLKDLRTPVFALSIIDRALVNDEKPGRFSNLRKKGLFMDGKDPITSNMDLQSVIQYPLDSNDHKMVDIYLRELYENNTYSINKYSQMMRILPLILKKKTYNSMDYFKFFIDSDMQEQNDDVERVDKVEDEDEILDDEVFKGEEMPEFVTFSQFFPEQLQDQIDKFTDQRVQVFSEDTGANMQNLTVTSTLRSQFNLMSRDYKSQGSKYEVLASHIDYKPFILGKKIQALEKATSIDAIKEIKDLNMNSYVLSNMISTIMDLTKGRIDEQKSIRDIIDYQYFTTKKFFYFNLFIYTFGYFLPLIMQMNSSNRQFILICNTSCLVLQAYCLVYEAISIISDGYKIYFNSWWNFIDCLTIVTYFFYFFIRFQYLDDHIVPKYPTDDAIASLFKFNDNQMQNMPKETKEEWIDEYIKLDHDLEIRLYSPLIHILLITTAFLKLMYYLRCQPDFGQFVQLVISCINDVKIFSIFFIAWVAIFSYLFKVAGAQMGDEADYPLLPGLSFYLQTYRNSIGDISPPGYQYWEKMHKYDSSKVWGYSQCMIYLIWLLWFFNQFFNLIILLNFLIAIVSQSYDRVLADCINYQYSHKSELNEETQRFFKVFRKPARFDIMCIVSSHEDDINQTDQIQGLSYSIKLYVKQQIHKMQEEVQSRFDKSDKINEITIERLRKYIDEQFHQSLDGTSAIRRQVTMILEKVGKGISDGDEPSQNDQKVEKIVEMMRANAVLLEQVSKQQLSEGKKQASIESTLNEQVQRDREEQRRLQESMEQTDNYLREVTGKLDQSLENNEQLKSQLTDATKDNVDMKNQLDQYKTEIGQLLQNSNKEISQLSEIASTQNEKYQALSQEVDDMKNNLSSEVTNSVQDMKNVFDQQFNTLKEVIEKQAEDMAADDDDQE